MQHRGIYFFIQFCSLDLLSAYSFKRFQLMCVEIA